MLSLVCVVKNEEKKIEKFLRHYDWVDEIVVVDNGSDDKTVEIVKRFKTKVYINQEYNLGKLKQFALEQTKADWILLLDTDEILSQRLIKEIKRVVQNTSDIHGYWIPYQNYAFGKPVYYGGERYSKIRLFRRKYGSVSPVPIHEEVSIKGKLGQLSGVIHHHSYRTLRHVFIKFTKYGWLVAGEKLRHHEKITFPKLFMHSFHMFWVRYIENQGWRDGWHGLMLASLFAYMEGLTYWLVLIRHLFHL